MSIGVTTVLWDVRGQFHKGLELGIFHRDSSIHLRPMPTPKFYATKKLLKIWALRFAPRTQLFVIDPRALDRFS